MAMKSALSAKALSCTLCCHIYEDPVLLPCHHSFCKACLEEYRKMKKTLKCPDCKKTSPKGMPPLNLQLKAMCEKFLLEKNNSMERPETFCKLHREKLKLFCLEDKEPVCTVCQYSKAHSKHNFREREEAAVEHRGQLQSKLKPLDEKLNLFLDAKLVYDQTVQHIKKQAQHTERKIKEEFEKLHQFLRDEEEKSLSALKEEEERKRKAAVKTRKSIDQEILRLSEIITYTHEELASEDVPFLQNYKATIKRIFQCELKDPEILSGLLIDVAKHLGNLQFRVWQKMRHAVSCTPVTLDPNTAHHHLSISDDLTSFVYKEEHQRLLKNPERFIHHMWVLGSVGFLSGTHCYDVEVENCQQWALGVKTGSVGKGKTYFSAGIWKCNYENIIYGASSSGGPTILLKVRERLKKIRVQLDWNRGQVSFSNPFNGRLLQTFSYPFTELVFPYFCNQCKFFPLRILPKEVSIDMQLPDYDSKEQICLGTHSSA